MKIFEARLMVTNSSRIVFAVIDLATKKLLSCYGHGRLSENKEEEKKRRKKVKEILEDLGSSIALFKAERKEELKREKEALSLLKTLIKRAKKEKVVISLSSGNCPPLVIEWGRIVTGEQHPHPPFVSLKELMKEGGQFVLLRKKVFSILYLALEGKVEVKIE